MDCHHQHDHQHQHDSPDRGLEYTLYLQIDTPNIRCLNQLPPTDSCQQIFKSFSNRFNPLPLLTSDCDPQLIICIPFLSIVKIKSISIIGPPGNNPSRMLAFVNRQDVDFDSIDDITPEQSWDLIQDIPRETMPEYPTKISKFSNVRNLTLAFTENFDESLPTIISYIGLKGEFMIINKDPIITIYESAANPTDHKLSNDVLQSSNSIS